MIRVHYSLFGDWYSVDMPDMSTARAFACLVNVHTLGRYPKLLRSERLADFWTAFDWLVDELRLINEF